MDREGTNLGKNGKVKDEVFNIPFMEFLKNSKRF